MFKVVYDKQALISILESRIEKLLDSKAIDMGYSSQEKLCSYVYSANEKWSAEAKEFVSLRDKVWDFFHTEIEKLDDGKLKKFSEDAFITKVKALIDGI